MWTMVLGALIVAENTRLAGPLRYGGSWVLVLESVRSVGEDAWPEGHSSRTWHIPGYAFT